MFKNAGKKFKIAVLCLLAALTLSSCGQKCEKCGNSGQMYKFKIGLVKGEETESILCESCLQKTIDSYDGLGSIIGSKMPYTYEKI